MRQTLRGIVARSDAPPSVRYVRHVSARQVSRSAWFFIQVRRPVLRFTFDCLPCLWRFGLYHTFGCLSRRTFYVLFPIWKRAAVQLTVWIIPYVPRFVNDEFGFFQKNFRIRWNSSVSVCFALYYSYFNVWMFCILGIWDQTDICKLNLYEMGLQYKHTCLVGHNALAYHSGRLFTYVLPFR